MPDLKRNRLCLILDALGWPLGQSFLSPHTIVAMFVARLSGSTMLVGLMTGLQSAFQFLPQLFASHWIERLRRTKIYVVVVGAFVERLPLLVLVIVLLSTSNPQTILVVFFVCWMVVNLGTGLNMPAFITLFARSMPAEGRGMVSGVGNSAGTLLASVGALAAGAILRAAGDYRGYAWCFLIGFGVLIATVLPLGAIDEPAVDPEERRSVRAHLRGVPELLRRRGFAGYIVLQVALNLCLAGTSFLTSFAVLTLGVPEATIAAGSAVMMAATAGSSLLFGLLADKRGYRLVWITGGFAALALYTAVLLAPGLGTLFFGYLMAGTMVSAQLVGSNMTMEYAGTRRTATYTALVFTAVAPARAGGPVLLGWLAEGASTRLIFALLALFALAAVYLALARLYDPRRDVSS